MHLPIPNECMTLRQIKLISLLIVCGLCLLPLGVLADSQVLADDEGVPVGDTVVDDSDSAWGTPPANVALVIVAIIVLNIAVGYFGAQYFPQFFGE